MQFRRRPSAVAAAALAAAVGIVSGGCTTSEWDTSELNDDTPTTVRRYTSDQAGLEESLTDYLSAVGDDLGEWAAPRDQASCAAQRLVRRLTVDHILELGFDPQAATLALDFPAEEKASVVNILLGCIDFSSAILETYSSYQKLPLAQSSCFAEGFDRLGLTRDLVSGLVDGSEPDPFANSDRMASGMASLAVECLEEDDLLPNAPMPRLPEAKNSPGTTTSTTAPPDTDDDGDLEGIEPGGPLDTTTTAPDSPATTGR